MVYKRRTTPINFPSLVLLLKTTKTLQDILNHKYRTNVSEKY